MLAYARPWTCHLPSHRSASCRSGEAVERPCGIGVLAAVQEENASEDGCSQLPFVVGVCALMRTAHSG
jgi:hypothetical protein